MIRIAITPDAFEATAATIAHAAGNKTERAYCRGDTLARRRELLQAWADFLDGKDGKGGAVVPFRGRRA